MLLFGPSETRGCASTTTQLLLVLECCIGPVLRFAPATDCKRADQPTVLNLRLCVITCRYHTLPYNGPPNASCGSSSNTPTHFLPLSSQPQPVSIPLPSDPLSLLPPTSTKFTSNCCASRSLRRHCPTHYNNTGVFYDADSRVEHTREGAVHLITTGVVLTVAIRLSSDIQNQD